MIRKERTCFIHRLTDDLQNATDMTNEHSLYYENPSLQQTGLRICQVADVEFRMRNIPAQIQCRFAPLNSSLHFNETKKSPLACPPLVEEE